MTWSIVTIPEDVSDLTDPYTAADFNEVNDAIRELWDDVQIISGNGINAPSDNIEGLLTKINTAMGAASKSEVRNSVLIGGVDASNVPNYLSTDSGLSVDLDATTLLIVSFAGGYTSTGAIDNIAVITVDDSFDSLTDDTTCYLYFDFDGSNVSTGHTILAPEYSTAIPGSPATDQHWLDMISMKMKVYDGADWQEYKRVFVGSCITASGSVSSIIIYPFRSIGKIRIDDVHGNYIESSASGWNLNGNFTVAL